MEALITLGSVYAFMLVPIWIPLIAVGVTAVADTVRGVRER